MKKRFFVGMAAMALGAVLVLAGCDGGLTNSGTSGGGGTSIPSATTLTLNDWENGALAAKGEQWFKFTATAATQYIHVALGTLTGVYVQLYNSAGNVFGSSYTIYEYSSNNYVSPSVTSGSVYYIKVTPYSSRSGEYKIGFTTSATTPGEMTAMASAPTLTLNSWKNDEFAAYEAHFFKFTATAATQYIHVALGTLTGVYVQLYNSTGNVFGSSYTIYEYSSNNYVSLPVTSGSMYYVKVWPYSSSRSGEYKIGFTTSATTPGEMTAMASAPTLTLNSWKNDEFAAYEAHFFKFTATAATQYIHVALGTLTGVYVQLYNSTGNAFGSSHYIYEYSSNNYVSLSVTSGSVYYIKVWPYSSSRSGGYKIAFNASATPSN